MSSPRFQYTVSGMMYGVKINRKNSLNVLKTRTRQVQARMTRLAAETIERRINDRSYHEKLKKGGRGVEGTDKFESNPKAIGKYKHTPHESIENPLTRIVDNALKVTAKSFARKGVEVEAKISQERISIVRFYFPKPKEDKSGNLSSPLKKIPRASTVWKRLDETCLPFYSNGNYEKLVAQWSRSTQRAVQRAFLKEFKGDLRKAPKVRD